MVSGCSPAPCLVPRRGGSPLPRSWRARVADAVAALPDVVAQAHWEIGSQSEVNGVDFYVGEEELGHIHLDGEAHIPVGPKVARILVERGHAQAFRWSRAFVVVDTADRDRALRIFELRRAQIDGVAERELLARLE
jgi:hypothetical protein